MCSFNDPQNLDYVANAVLHVSCTTFQLFEILYLLSLTNILIIYSIAYLRGSWWNWSRTCTSPIQGWKETSPKTRGTHTIATIRLARGKQKINHTSVDLWKVLCFTDNTFYNFFNSPNSFVSLSTIRVIYLLMNNN